jgi:hypothetical protein
LFWSTIIFLFTINHTYIHTYIHTYVYTYIHTYIHSYIHTYIYKPSLDRRTVSESNRRKAYKQQKERVGTSKELGRWLYLNMTGRAYGSMRAMTYVVV